MLETLDLRPWLDAVAARGELDTVRGADWNLEIGAISEVNVRQRNNHALMFDAINGYPEGFRVLTCSLSSPVRMGLAFRLGDGLDDASLVAALEGRPLAWEQSAPRFQPRAVPWGPVLENVMEAKDCDLLRFPVPRWHEMDGGRYLGTGCAVITRNRATGVCNVGSYRMMVVDERRVVLNVGRGKHGKLNNDGWWEQGEPAPVVACIGHDPLLFALAGTEVAAGVSELDYAGAVIGRPIDVVVSDLTGLPIPATAEIVVEGWVHADRMTDQEGPFGEWTGYYSDQHHNEPIIQLGRVLYRHQPVILGAPPARPPHDFSYFRTVLKSAMIKDALLKAGVPEVKGVWSHEAGGGRQFIVVSIRQRYAGHARQAGFVASQTHAGAYMGKYVVVVDDDIDPRDLDQVVWAMCFRCDPAGDIDFIRRAWASRADPFCFDHERSFNSRAIVDACTPWEHRDRVPPVARISKEMEQAVRAKWGSLWNRSAGGGPGDGVALAAADSAAGATGL